jgi:hypothetical protein
MTQPQKNGLGKKSVTDSDDAYTSGIQRTFWIQINAGHRLWKNISS